MNAPFYKFGAFGDEVSLMVAFAIGIAFGFVLERAGFGSARKLAAQFYFKDLSVFKVMFTAIITAMIGVTLLSRFGLVDLSLIYMTPTYLVPQIVGGLILGVGFVIGGYCPGTSVVSMGTGRVDGLVYLVGVVGGLLGYAEIYPWIADWSHSTDLGQVTLPEYFGLPYGLVVAGVVLMAVVAFAAAEWAERRFGGVTPTKGSLVDRPWRLTPVRGLMIAMVVLGVIALMAGDPYRGSRTVLDTKQLALLVGGKQDHVTVEDLADRIIRGDNTYSLLDVRDAENYRTYHIPGAINIPVAEWEAGVIPRNETIILYSDGGIHAAQVWFLMQAQGYPSVYLLLGGLNAWMDDILYPVQPAGVEADPEAFARRAEVARFFGGAPQTGVDGGDATGENARPVLAPPVMPEGSGAPLIAPKRKRREGC